MNAMEKYDYWLEAATYDLESARVMMDGGRYMYVAFMCQQSIEKLTKGIYTLYTDQEAPRIHNIWNIFKQIINSQTDDLALIEGFEESLQKHKNFFAELLSFYISGRYPSFKEKVSSSINYDRAKNVLDTTEEVFKWIESLSQYKK